MERRPAEPRGIARRLLRWYDIHRRDLPWRRAPSPYRTLVSELMLQQTVVATVVPYFERFMRRFPDVRTLAAAPEGDVLALWSGLGYYARARNLHAAARAVVERHGGELPRDEEVLRTLPGVGPYTAAAVASIAFGIPRFALDGNAARVVARIHAVPGDASTDPARARLRALGQTVMPSERAGDFMQAVMELGALVCVSAEPRCGECPLRRDCRALAVGRQAEIPAAHRRPQRRLVRLACAMVERRGRVLLVRRERGELLAGTWALPSVEMQGTHGGADGGARRAAGALGLRVTRAALAGSIRHVFTHRDVTADVFRLTTRGTVKAGAALVWAVPSDLGALAISSFTRKTLRVAGVDGV